MSYVETRFVILQPKTQQAWETIAGGPDLHEGGLGFTCYTPVKSGEGSFEVADHDTSALVSFLSRNHVFSGSRLNRTLSLASRATCSIRLRPRRTRPRPWASSPSRS